MRAITNAIFGALMARKGQKVEEPTLQRVEMSENDKDVIQRFAAGDETLRQDAIVAYRRNLRIIGPKANLHQRFMGEVDNTSPDLTLRDSLRKQLIG